MCWTPLRNTLTRPTRKSWSSATARRSNRRPRSLASQRFTTRKGKEFNPPSVGKGRPAAGVILIFAGMISLGSSRVFIVLHLGQGITIFSFLGGALLLGL